MDNDAFWAPRRCLLEPIQEIYDAAQLLDAAVDAHIVGDRDKTEQLIKQADIPAIAEWTEALWGAKSKEVHRLRDTPSTLPPLPKDKRIVERMPTASKIQKLIERDGYHCRFCGIPVIDTKIRKLIRSAYPDTLRWGRKNSEQHAAFQCMWLTFDHVLPHSRGGSNSLDNMIIACQPCNCGKEDQTLDELGLIDPRTMPIHQSSWDGLERFAHHKSD